MDVETDLFLSLQDINSCTDSWVRSKTLGNLRYIKTSVNPRGNRYFPQEVVKLFESRGIDTSQLKGLVRARSVQIAHDHALRKQEKSRTLATRLSFASVHTLVETLKIPHVSNGTEKYAHRYFSWPVVYSHLVTTLMIDPSAKPTPTETSKVLVLPETRKQLDGFTAKVTSLENRIAHLESLFRKEDLL